VYVCVYALLKPHPSLLKREVHTKKLVLMFGQSSFHSILLNNDSRVILGELTHSKRLNNVHKQAELTHGPRGLCHKRQFV